MFNDFYRNKKVLVTGHTGFKGAWLSQLLLRLGANVAGYSLYIPSKPSLFESLSLQERLTNDYREDVCDADALQRAFNEFKPEIVFHLAAQPIVRTAYDEPVKTYQTNVMGTLNILETICHQPSVKIAVFITSDKCYENVEWKYGYRESDRLGGKDPYSASKACAEIIISSYWRSFLKNNGVKVASARAGNVIGGGDWAKDRIVPDCMMAWGRGDELVIRSPEATRPWQHVLEPLSGYLRLAQMLNENPGLAGSAYNFGPDASVNHSVKTLLADLSKYWRSSSHKVDRSDLAAKPEAGLLKLCCDKALMDLSWQPTLHYNDTVRFTAEWYSMYYQNLEDTIKFTTTQIKNYCDLAKKRGCKWAT